MSCNIRLGYILSETNANLRQNGLMSLAAIGAVVVSMFLLGAFLLLDLNLNAMLSEVSTKGAGINIYLRPGASAEEIGSLTRLIEGLDDVRKVRFVSVDEARAAFKKDLADQSDLGRIVDSAPLPASLQVEVGNTDRIPRIVSVITGQPAIDEIHYGQDLVEKLNLIKKVVQFGGLLSIVIICGMAVFIIANTIRLTVFARRREIRIMQLVGATDWFVKWPFILEGVFHGFVGSVMAVIVMAFAYGWLIRNWPLPFIFPLSADNQLLLYISALLLSVGMFVGAMGSFFSVKKFLRAA